MGRKASKEAKHKIIGPHTIYGCPGGTFVLRDGQWERMESFGEYASMCFAGGLK